MSTLVKIVMGIVLNILSIGDQPLENQVMTETELQLACESRLSELNPDYIITRDELLSLQNQ